MSGPGPARLELKGRQRLTGAEAEARAGGGLCRAGCAQLRGAGQWEMSSSSRGREFRGQHAQVVFWEVTEFRVWRVDCGAGGVHMGVERLLQGVGVQAGGDAAGTRGHSGLKAYRRKTDGPSRHVIGCHLPPCVRAGSCPSCGQHSQNPAQAPSITGGSSGSE